MPHDDHETNRAAWNEMVEVRFKHRDYRVKEFLDGHSTLKSIELAEVGDVHGKSLLHLMCQFGLDTLSWARLGALVTGVDISDKSIERAEELKRTTGLPAMFVRSDVLDLIGRIDRTFDIVFQSYGTLCWISDLTRWARVVAHFVKPGGIFYIIDTHPIAYIHEVPDGSYFDSAPTRSTNERDYCDRSYVINKELVEWQHPLSQVINALIQAGLQIESVNEFNKGYYPVQEDWYEQDGYWYPPGGPPRYPLMFSLRARRSGETDA
ncbi:MAG TPA: class I SAM-dependent methyltransferase [Candidatus Deferrimicrobium sp.]|nr:class I SAM-dependent methyltransferase [Candidatus Deferrimicrobium sp.]